MANGKTGKIGLARMRKPFGLLGIACLLAAVLPNGAASAATWHVAADGADTNGGTGWGDAYATIQKGVDTASDGDTVLVADGTYTGTGNKNIELQGKTITVKSLNGPESCIIDCQNSGRGFYVHQREGRDTVISGFTIQHGDAGDNYGGAIYCCDSSTPTVDGCIIKNNRASMGGGIGCLYTGATVTNCRIFNNSAKYGGGVYALWPWISTDNLVIFNCIVSGNTAFAPSASGQGGGILFAQPFNKAYLKVANSTVAGNAADQGGGIYLIYCAGEGIANTILEGNVPDNIAVNDCTPVVTYSSGSGYAGEGNIEEDPLFIGVTDPDPENWNLRLQPGSACIDAGSNAVSGLLDKDLDGKPRFVDADGDLLAAVDMGAYEHGDICECDYLGDLDTDAADLAAYIDNPGAQSLSLLAEDYGRTDCPTYAFTP